MAQAQVNAKIAEMEADLQRLKNQAHHSVFAQPPPAVTGGQLAFHSNGGHSGANEPVGQPSIFAPTGNGQQGLGQSGTGQLGLHYGNGPGGGKTNKNVKKPPFMGKGQQGQGQSNLDYLGRQANEIRMDMNENSRQNVAVLRDVRRTLEKLEVIGNSMVTALGEMNALLTSMANKKRKGPMVPKEDEKGSDGTEKKGEE